MKQAMVVVIAITALALISLASVVSTAYVGLADEGERALADGGDEPDQMSKWRHQMHSKWSAVEGDQPWKHCQEYSYAYQNLVEYSCNHLYCHDYDHSYQYCDYEDYWK